MIKVYVSYSYTSNEHEAWVQKLVDDLEIDPHFNMLYDKYDITCLNDKNLYIQQSIEKADRAILICDKAYKEKLENRNGDIGIEALHLMPSFYKDIFEKGKSKLIALAIEKDSIPTFIQNNPHIDFSDTQRYNQNLLELKRELQATPRAQRPRKERLDIDLNLELTNIENIIAESSKNRILIHQETNFSGSNKVKYEIWETKNPSSSLFIALHHNINIKQTLQSAERFLSSKYKNIHSITILRTRPARDTEQSLEILKGLSTNIIDITYKDFLWDYGIDAKLKEANSPEKIQYYTPQDIELTDGQKEADAAKFLANQVINSNQYAAHLVLADGGMGKTSLSQAIANEIKSINAEKTSFVIIHADSIRKHLSKTNSERNSLSSIYDLYDLQANYFQDKIKFGRTTFELAAITGNIVIILDGLDEIENILSISSIDFFDSIAKIHRELGSSQIIITSRNIDIINDEQAQKLGICKYKLLGFTPESCKRYLLSRFKEHDEKVKIADTLTKQIEKAALTENENRVVPFFVDILATDYEKNSDNSSNDYSTINSEIPYPSQGGIIDQLIFSIFRREQKRQKIEDVEIKDMIEIFTENCATLGEKWDKAKINENLKILYDSKSDLIMRAICVNPLIIHNESESILELKYEFLLDYFGFIYITNNIKKSSIEKDFLLSLAQLTDESAVMKEITKYYTTRKDEFTKNASTLIKNIRGKIDRSKREENGDERINNSAISAIISILGLLNGNRRMEEFTADLINILSICEKNGSITIDNLHINGNLPPIDFSNKKITNSSFENYRKFLKSKFDGSYFSYCRFSNCSDENIKDSKISQENFDERTCKLGDLRDTLKAMKAQEANEKELIEKETTTFLDSFIRGLNFRDNNKDHIRFSNKVPGLHKNNFQKLISKGYIVISSEKEVATFYEIPSHFKESVRKFLNDNIKDKKMTEFLEFIENK